MTEFFGVDGEAIDGFYSLLAASDETHITPNSGNELSSYECFEFLLSKQRKGRTIVCFGLNYDVNMWLRDLDREALEFLWSHHICVYIVNDRVYRLSWLPGHWFNIERASTPDLPFARVRIYEVWGFFQSSFVNALATWDLPLPPEIDSYKAQRGEFTSKDFQGIVRYCHNECISLVKLMEALRDACKIAGCVPRQWMGAGALASAILGKQKELHSHHRHDEELHADATEAIMSAYFGGRVELLLQGIYRDVHSADIRSAYPHAICSLPSLQDAQLVYRDSYTGEDHALWDVSWSNLPGNIMPFPVRCKGAIYYPTTGRGWYHTIEVTTALLAGHKLTIHGGWTLQSPSRISPFRWIPETFALREAWKREGNPGQRVLKLALNSLYGKLAQGVSYQPTDRENVKLPRWQSFFWAGEITARTRARMTEQALRYNQPAMIATDGLFYTDRKSRIQEQDGLGGWETSHYDRMFFVRAGVYLGERVNAATVENGVCTACNKDAGKSSPQCSTHPCIIRSRGFSEREVDFYDVMSHWDSEGITGAYTFNSHRFIGLGVALMRKDFSAWRKWEDKERRLSYLPSSKDVNVETGEIKPFSGELPRSEPFVPKMFRASEDEQQAAEQPQTV